ncbi:MAG: hypothetical protein KatS3mg010_0342 [Acidimicrobiia bacterium]|nr:MAG: hypothetical protein KatS3mg010_0342 [Acidimicrobiia bacterium]
MNLGDEEAVRGAARELLAAATPDDGDVELLVAPMVKGARELIAGLVRDPQFGPCVMLGVGGVLAEAIGDVAFRLVPLSEPTPTAGRRPRDANGCSGRSGASPQSTATSLRACVIGLSRLAQERPDVASVDSTPSSSWTAGPSRSTRSSRSPPTRRGPPRSVCRARAREGFRALFEPRGVIVAGASTHPGKFGFVALHNILAAGYGGRVAATNLEGTPVLGVADRAEHRRRPRRTVGPRVRVHARAANVDLLRSCAKRGVRAAFVTSAGYGEAGERGREAERELVALAAELGMLLAGPNGQGVVSTPASLCAQIVAPYPPAGRIAIASQSGNFVSSFQNWACRPAWA